MEEDYALVGRRSGRSFRMGDKVRVKLVAANLTKRQLDYEWVLYVEDTADGQSVKPKPKDKKEKQKTKTKPAGKPTPSRKHR